MEMVRVYTHPTSDTRIISEGWTIDGNSCVGIEMPDRNTCLYVYFENDGLKLELYKLDNGDIGECIYEEIL